MVQGPDLIFSIIHFLLCHLIHHSHSLFLSCSPQMITGTWYSSQLPSYLLFSLSFFLWMHLS